MPFLGQSPAAVITGNGILDGTVTAADLHTTLDLSTKTITYPSNSVTAAALHTTAVTDKLGYTPLQSSDLTGYATESYVTTAVSNLVDSAPGALDTLNELAAALNDDANFSTTITNSLALKAPLASPSFTGNVGIGTSSPLGRLSVLGEGRLVTIGDSGTANTPALTVRNTIDTGYGFFNISTYRTRFFTEGSERMVINESGNVGIGTSSPIIGAKLHVVDATASGAYIQYDGQSNTEFGLKIESNVSGGNFESDYGVGGTALLDLFANSASVTGGDLLVARTQSATPVLLVKGNGNVGIGTSSPDYKLHVANSTDSVMLLESGNTSSGVLLFGDTDSNFRGQIQYNHSNDSMNFFAGGLATTDMIITSSGNVGIGTSSPSQKLTVRGGRSVFQANSDLYSIQVEGASAAGQYYIGATNEASPSLVFSNVGGIERMRIDSSGNVGIGTSSPATKLSFGSYIPSNGQTLHIYQNGNTRSGLGVVSGVYRIYTSSDASMAFGNVSTSDGSTFTERMRIDTAGRITVKKYNGTAASPTESGDWPTPVLNLRGYGNFTLESMLSFGYSNDAEYQTGGDVWNFRLNGVASATTSSSSTHLNLSGPGRFYLYSNGDAIFSPGGSEKARIDTSGNLKFNSGYGSAATAYGCRAWVNFNGTGTVAIRGGGNISSVTDNGTGDYTVNFSTAMPDSNYAVTVGYDTSPNNNTRSSHTFDMYNFLTTSVRVLTSNTNLTASDFNYVFLAIHR